MANDNNKFGKHAMGGDVPGCRGEQAGVGKVDCGGAIERFFQVDEPRLAVGGTQEIAGMRIA